MNDLKLYIVTADKEPWHEPYYILARSVCEAEKEFKKIERYCGVKDIKLFCKIDNDVKQLLDEK